MARQHSDSQDAYLEQLTARFRELARRELEQAEGDGRQLTLDEIEALVSRVKDELGREMQQSILDRQVEAAANRAPCRCGGWARFRQCEARLLLTRHGESKRFRRWYRCDRCRHGFSPLDHQLGLDRRGTSTYLRLLIADWTVDRVFERCSRDLARTLGIQLSASTVERIAVGIGERLRQALRAEGQAFEDGDLPVPERQPRIIHISMDGVFAPLREPWKRDGSAGELVTRGGECKVGAVFEVQQGPRKRDRLAWREYVATFGDIEAFRPQLAQLAYRCGVERATTVVFLADGARCNWKVADDYFPTAVRIVDWYHAVEHLGTVAEAFFGSGTACGAEWLRTRKRELWEGRVHVVLEAIALLPPRTAEQEETQRTEHGYFEHNRERMRYPAFRAAGYQIGSGVVEASCRTIVNQRFDQSGMHWRQETADALVALRANALSSRRRDLTAYCSIPN